MVLFRPYRYSRRRPERIEPEAPPREPSDDEGLTGYVRGLEASDIEERFARALDAYEQDYIFQFEVTTAFTLPHQEKQVDFLVTTGQPRPVEIDGTWVHKSAEQREYDSVRDAQVNQVLRPRGYLPVMRISGDELVSQEFANSVVETYIA